MTTGNSGLPRYFLCVIQQYYVTDRTQTTTIMCPTQIVMLQKYLFSKVAFCHHTKREFSFFHARVNTLHCMTGCKKLRLVAKGAGNHMFITGLKAPVSEVHEHNITTALHSSHCDTQVVTVWHCPLQRTVHLTY